MLTHVEFRSAAFPAYESENEEVNPGVFGKRLAEFLAAGLRDQGERIEKIGAEDWGWYINVENAEFRLWIGVGNYEEYPDGFLCFIEPHKEYVRKLLKKVSTKARVEQLQARMDTVLRLHEDIRELKWWNHDEFNNPSA